MENKTNNDKIINRYNIDICSYLLLKHNDMLKEVAVVSCDFEDFKTNLFNRMANEIDDSDRETFQLGAHDEVFNDSFDDFISNHGDEMFDIYSRFCPPSFRHDWSNGSDLSCDYFEELCSDIRDYYDNIFDLSGMNMAVVKSDNLEDYIKNIKREVCRDIQANTSILKSPNADAARIRVSSNTDYLLQYISYIERNVEKSSEIYKYCFDAIDYKDYEFFDYQIKSFLLDDALDVVTEEKEGILKEAYSEYCKTASHDEVENIDI